MTITYATYQKAITIETRVERGEELDALLEAFNITEEEYYTAIL